MKKLNSTSLSIRFQPSSPSSPQNLCILSTLAIEDITSISSSISMIAPKTTTTIPSSPPHTKRWGFAIYRCDYSDESQWKSYMSHFKRAVRDELQDTGAPLSAWGRLDWTILENQKDLDGVSKEDIQERFIALNDQGLTIKMPVCAHGGWRFKHEYDSCVYVDKWCLDTLDLHEDWLDRGAPGSFQPVLCAVMNDMSSPG
ncbi:hypothetical protein CEP54_015475, partial [Fusarium duplospermum]